MKIQLDKMFNSESMREYDMRRAERTGKAIKIMLGDGAGKDTYSSKNYSPYLIYEDEVPVALVKDLSPAANFQFYFDYYDNPQVLLDAVNFAQVVESVGGKDNYEFGTYRFWETSKEQMQVVPKYAIPRMNPSDYRSLYTNNNTLILNEKSYQTFHSSDGESYVMAISKKRITYACTEMHYDWIVKGKDLQNSQGTREARDIGILLSTLAMCDTRGSVAQDKKVELFKLIGIHPGPFRVIFEGQTYNYYLYENGKVTQDKS